MEEKWTSIQEACVIMDISESTLRRRIAAGEVTSRGEGRNRVIYIDPEIYPDTAAEELQENEELIDALKKQIEFLQEQNRELQTALRQQSEQYENSRERQDVIILNITRNLENAQKQQEADRPNLWKKIKHHLTSHDDQPQEE